MITAPSAGSSYTLTPASRNGYASIKFGTDGDTAVLIFTNNTWNIVSLSGATETPQTLTASGAVDPTTPVTLLDSSGGGWNNYSCKRYAWCNENNYNDCCW